MKVWLESWSRHRLHTPGAVQQLHAVHALTCAGCFALLGPRSGLVPSSAGHKGFRLLGSKGWASSDRAPFACLSSAGLTDPQDWSWLDGL